MRNLTDIQFWFARVKAAFSDQMIELNELQQSGLPYDESFPVRMQAAYTFINDVEWRISNTPAELDTIVKQIYKIIAFVGTALPDPAEFYNSNIGNTNIVVGNGIAVPLATNTIYGKVRLNVAADVATDPVVLGANDPRIADWVTAYNRSITGISINSAGQIVVDRQNDVQVTSAQSVIINQSSDPQDASYYINGTARVVGQGRFDDDFLLTGIQNAGSPATRFLSWNDTTGAVNWRTSAEVLSDIGGAPASGSGNYIQNQNASAQTANAWIDGTLRADTRVQLGDNYWFNPANISFTNYVGGAVTNRPSLLIANVNGGNRTWAFANNTTAIGVIDFSDTTKLAFQNFNGDLIFAPASGFRVTAQRALQIGNNGTPGSGVLITPMTTYNSNAVQKIEQNENRRLALVSTVSDGSIIPHLVASDTTSAVANYSATNTYYRIERNNTPFFDITYGGNIKFVVAPTASVGSYDILTRNTSTGEIEKIASSSLALTMQNTYNNSTIPQITTTTALGAVTMRRGSAADTDNVLMVQNGAGSNVMSVTGAGVMTLATALGIASGGTGLSTTPTNGQIDIGNGTGFTRATLTGTANQVTVTNGAGSITLSLPQAIATTSTVQFGRMGVGNAVGVGQTLRVAGNITGATTSNGIRNDGVVQSDVTSSHRNYVSTMNTQATAFTLADYQHYRAEGGTVGAGSSVTNVYGFIIPPTFSITGTTNRFGFASEMAAGATSWDLYLSGGAKSYILGNLLLGSTTDTGEKLQVTGTVRFNTALGVSSGGLGISTTPSNGFIPIGNGTNYVSAAITGTANQVTVTNGAGSITLSLPQSIATTSTPQFAKLGLGTSSLVGYILRSISNLTGATSSFAIEMNNTAQSDVTSAAINYRSILGTQATAFTLNEATHFIAQQGTFGLGSTVTEQNGFVAFSSLTGATNNYGFRGRIAAATGRWNAYMDGTAANYFNGNVLIGSTTDGGQKLQVTGTANITGNTTIGGTLVGSSTAQFTKLGLGNATAVSNYFRIGGSATGTNLLFGSEINQTIQSDVTTSYQGNRVLLTTQATVFTLTNGIAYNAGAVTIGAGSTITNLIGYNVESTFVGGANTFAFRGSIPSGSGRWNAYMDGTAANYFNGNVQIGSTTPTSGAEKLQVTGAQSINTTFGTSLSLLMTDTDTDGTKNITQVIRNRTNYLVGYDFSAYTEYSFQTQWTGAVPNTYTSAAIRSGFDINSGTGGAPYGGTLRFHTFWGDTNGGGALTEHLLLYGDATASYARLFGALELNTTPVTATAAGAYDLLVRDAGANGAIKQISSNATGFIKLRRASINALVTGTYVLSNLQDNFIPVGYSIVVNNATAVATDATISIGTNSPNYDNIAALPASGVTNANATDDVFTSFFNDAEKFRLMSSNDLRVNVSVAATGTTYNIDIILFGYVIT